MRNYLIVCLFLLFSCSSENQKVEGKIVNEEGKAIHEVLVQVMGTDLYTYSDEEGYFAINSKSRGTELIFNKEGYQLGREEIDEDEIMQIKLISIPMQPNATNDSSIKPD